MMMWPLTALAMVAVQTGAPSPVGHWRNPRGTVVIAVAPCGEALCGTVTWASDQAIADARRGGTEPLVGTELLSRFVPAGADRWKGSLFVPDVNKRSKAELRLVGPDRLKVSGCAVGRLLCKSQVWTRTEARLAQPPPK